MTDSSVQPVRLMSDAFHLRWFTLVPLLAAALLSACGGGSSEDPAPVPVIQPDVAIASFDDPLVGYQWYLESIRAVSQGDYVRNRSGDLITGNQVRVAVIDTGLEITHPDIQENLTPNASYNFFTRGSDPAPNTTTEGDHGTAVAGLLAARGGNSKGMIGVAPSAELRAFKILNSEGVTNISITDQLAAIGYDPQINHPSLVTSDLAVFNLSYGFPITYDPTPNAGAYDSYYDPLFLGLESGTQTLRAGKGALYVKAAGNEFEKIDTSGSCAQANQYDVTCFNTNFEPDQTIPYVIPIGAYSTDDKKAWFSNTGSALWLTAPGVTVLSTDQSGCATGYSQINNGTRTDSALATVDENCDYISYFGGSSAATPIVSGALALLLEANPNLTWRDAKHILALSARKIDANLSGKTLSVPAVAIEQGWVTNAANIPFSNYYGFGALDVSAAVAMATDNYQSLPALQLIGGDDDRRLFGSVTNGGAIADKSAVGITERLNVNQTDNLQVESVRLTLSMTAQGALSNFDFSDYVITLISPSGTQSIVMTPFTGFDKQSAVTDLPMISHAFYGERLNGDWQLKIQDVDSQSGLTGLGKLVDWSLSFYAHEAQE
ncbi:serine protease [Thiosulfatimonas sediminis]|uniref:Serine protease n=1 Tax=Thiosulfatimonas sediminis TaxID=2675054 RepID=A0A6F8PSR3_9GAMM|nr:S8 family serine peptidase [Thiosulfatimonas sediminis]BBP45058.1 serine protease [Thiosulfatimonas sediminis]